MRFICDRCRVATPDITHCRSTDQFLCEDCIITLAAEYFSTISPSIVPESDAHD